MAVEWEQDGVDPQWWTATGVGAVRGPAYRGRGWYFLPADKPDKIENDVGPFQTRAAAFAAATATR